MSGIDLATAEAKLVTWLAAEEKIGVGQSVAINGRSLSYADLAEVAARIDYWDRKVKQLARASSVSMRRMVLHD